MLSRCVSRALFVLALHVCLSSARRDSAIYHNQFAVYVPEGDEHVTEIAKRHGFDNYGQIGKLKGYYLLSHSNIHKRSLNISEDHHHKLRSEPKVRWFQQQHEKRRLKRDYGAEGSFESSLWSSVQRRPHRNYHRALSSSPVHFPDPLFKEQWYLNGGAKDGLDMNVLSAWQKGYTGKGVVVSILDDGIQTNHPDLAQNYDAAASTDINGNDDDPMPQDNGDNKHGTRCAGEVAGVAFNLYCGVGIAYNASIGGVRMLDGVVNDAVEARALGLNPDHIDIYSASWGPEDDGKTVDGPGPLARRAFIYGVTSGRRGKGSIFVWASGNGGRHTDSCNCDGYTNSIFTLSISSATQGGFKPWYLEECSSTLASTYSSGTPGHDKSVATVDMDGRLRPDHICTVEHTGTSASAPLAAGICALALEANPDLTWRDMQYLVVMTSRSRPLEKEPGWIINGVKRKVSHKFGYGLMDATEMVNLAERWSTVPPQHICKSQEIAADERIEPTYGYTLTQHMDVNGCSGTVNEVRYLEHVQCKISLRFFPRGNLRIMLTSPMGTTSTLLFERPRDVVSSNFDDWPFLSVHFWGEKAEGRWTLQIVNAGNRRVDQPGVLRKWQLIFYGTAVDPVRLRSSGRPLSPSYSFPTAAENYESLPDGAYDPESFGLQGYPQFAAAASNPVASLASLDGHNIPSAQRENVMSDANDKIVQHSCDPECDSQGCYGRGPTQCMACKHYRLDNTCVSRCPPRSFANGGGVCWRCHESCETCAGAGQDSCLSCAPSHLLVPDLAVCLQQCPEGYLEDTENGKCVPCAANCNSCSDKPDHCTACERHLVLYDGTCEAACPLGTFERDDYTCVSCHWSCETCNGSTDGDCVTCKTGNYAFDGKCVGNCPAKYYADKKRRECMACPVGCASCNSAFCLTCEAGWKMNKKNKCVPEGTDKCSLSEFYANNSCHKCHPDCESCTGPAGTSCLSCSPPLLSQQTSCVAECSAGWYGEAGLCAHCPNTCRSCVTRLNCTSCAEGLKLQSGSCRARCADGYYSDRDLCASCYLSCATCSGPRRDQCVTCPAGWKLAAGECTPECPQGFFTSPFGCQKCHHYCSNCNGEGPLACTSCPQHFMLERGLCVECLSSQYYDAPSSSCRSCHETCRACSGPGQYSCIACAPPLHLDGLNNQCVPCCGENSVENTNTTTPSDCCRCDKETGGCQNSSPAGKRRIADKDPYYAAAAHGAPRGSYWLSGGWRSPLTDLVFAVCAAAIFVFLVIFTILQSNSNTASRQHRHNSDGYAPVSCDETDAIIVRPLSSLRIKSDRSESEPLLEATT